MSENERIGRAQVPALDEILGLRFPILDDGFVRVIDYMGCDAAIVQAARVSYGAGTKHIREDRGLLRYLMRHRHTTPFEMCELKLHVRVPMDTWRQWIRHRMASVNEYSTRYSVAIDAAQKTEAMAWRRQATENRQGSQHGLNFEHQEGAQLTCREAQLQTLAREVYQERLERGVAREQARKDLPLSTYTEAYWKIDLHNLLHFLELRMDSHAQLEIRAYADVIGNNVVSKWCPLAWEAFVDYRREALYLSRQEKAIIAAITAGDERKAVDIAVEAGLLPPSGKAEASSRERTELTAKLRELGLRAPWA